MKEKDLGMDLSRALCFAAFDADTPKVEQLLAAGADVNSVGDRRSTVIAHCTPIWLVVRNGGLIIAEHWGEFIGNLGQVLPQILNRDDREKRRRFLQVAQILIQANANLELHSYGTTPLAQAAHACDLEMVRLLLSNGANPNAESFSILSRLAKEQRIKGPMGMMGYCDTVLHQAVEKNSLPIVEALLAAGAQPARTDHEGKTPFDLAREKGFDEIARVVKKVQSAVSSP